MEQLIGFVLQFGNLNQQQIDFITSRAVVLQLHKDDFYWEAGKMVKQVGFLTEGVVRVYYYNNQGEEITRYFIDENHLILPDSTMDEVYVPSEYLSALTDCTMIVFSKQDWKEIAETVIGWETIVQKITTKQHRKKMEARGGLVSQDATKRYLDFMEKFPNLLNRVPLSYLASYLGITQSSLSRIRKNIR